MRSLVALILACFLAGLFWRVTSRETAEKIFEPPSRPVEVADPCPWRFASTDLTNWFPGATGYETRDLILSGQRVELQNRVGRPLLPEEMALHLYVPLSNGVKLGSVLTRRLKGPNGAIEIALAVQNNGQVINFRIQRMREPESLTRGLESLSLPQRFIGKTAADVFPDFSEMNVDSATLRCARDISSAVRTLLILLDAGEAKFNTKHH